MNETTQKFLAKPSSSYKMLMWSTLALSILGAVMVFSASSIYSLENRGNSFSIIGRQLFFLVIAIPIGFLASRQKLDRWKKLARFGFLFSGIVLVIVAIPGVGKPYDEGGRDKYNVYEVTDDNRIKVRNGYYLVDKGTVVMDDDGDFPLMKIGEPVWDNVDVKVPKEKEKEKEKEPEVSKSDFIVINNDATGDCFYDAVIRAETNSADDYSGEKIGQLRTAIANFISKTPQFRETLIEKYNSYKKNELKRMNQVEGYKDYYKRVEDDGEDEDSVIADLKKKLPALKDELFQKFPDEFYPDPTQEDVIHLLTEYFDKRTDLTGDQIIETFVKNVKEAKKWVVEDVVAAYQEMNNVQVVPLIKKGVRVEDYMVHPTVLKKEELLSTTRYIFAEYAPLTHFKLIVRASDKKGAFLQSDLPAALQRKMAESPILSKADDPPSPLYVPEPVPPPAPAPAPAPAADVPGMELESGEPVPEEKVKEKEKEKGKGKGKGKTVPISQVETIQLKPPTDDGTRKLTDVPEISQADLDLINKMKTFDAYEYATKTMPWGKYFTDKGYEAYTAATLKTKQEISTTEKLVKALQAHPNDPTPFYKTKKAATEKKKK